MLLLLCAILLFVITSSFPCNNHILYITQEQSLLTSMFDLKDVTIIPNRFGVFNNCSSGVMIVECKVELQCLPIKRRSIVHCWSGSNSSMLVHWVENTLHISGDPNFRFWLNDDRSNLFLGTNVALQHTAPTMSELWTASLESRPILFSWDGLKGLDMATIVSQHPDRVWVKIAERSKQFEGAQRASEIPGNEAALNSIPPAVREAFGALEDIVVPRPHHWETTMAEFLKRIQGTPRATFYLEYFPSSALPSNVQLPRAADWKPIGPPHLWLGANTTGRLHFDQYENINCVAHGTKTFTIHHPHNNENFYESHLRQVMLKYDFATDTHVMQFDESTSLVMSPIDMGDPFVFERFPLFRNASPWKIEVRAGQCLYLPAFWWHEVVSSPPPAGEDEYVLAVNTWFEPVLTRDFPCPSCRLKANLAVYRKQLQQLYHERLQEREL